MLPASCLAPCPDCPALPLLPHPCSKRKKKEGMSEGEAKAVVEGLLAMMEVAVEEDHKQYEQGAVRVLHRLWLCNEVVCCRWPQRGGAWPRYARSHSPNPACLPLVHTTTNNAAGRPAVHKLRLLSRVEDVLSTKRLHNELLDAGLLGGGCGLGLVPLGCAYFSAALACPRPPCKRTTRTVCRSAQGLD